MSERQSARTDGQDGEKSSNTGRIDRRRLLQVAGVGIAGGVLATGAVLANDHTLPHTIIFDGGGYEETATYAFGVTDAVEKHDDVGSIQNNDTIDGTDVEGSIGGGVDAYRFAGNITHLDMDGPLDVSIEYADQSDQDRLEVVAGEDNDSLEYTFTVDGPVEPDMEGENSADVDDRVWENEDGPSTVSGSAVNGYGDSFLLSGNVTSFGPIEGDFTILLNGTVVTPAELVE